MVNVGVDACGRRSIVRLQHVTRLIDCVVVKAKAARISAAKVQTIDQDSAALVCN